MLKDAALFIYFFHSSGVPICFLSIYKVPGAVPGILCKLSCVILIITLRLNNLPKVTLPEGAGQGSTKYFYLKDTSNHRTEMAVAASHTCHFHNQQH